MALHAWPAAWTNGAWHNTRQSHSHFKGFYLLVLFLGDYFVNSYPDDTQLTEWNPWQNLQFSIMVFPFCTSQWIVFFVFCPLKTIHDLSNLCNGKYWRIQGAPPAPPQTTQILSFLHTNFPERRCVGPWYPTYGVGAPFGKSWIRHWEGAITRISENARQSLPPCTQRISNSKQCRRQFCLKCP